MEIQEPAPTEREECSTCYKPVRHCFCDAIRNVSHDTHITIIQHPRERRHPFNTVRILEQALESVTVHPFFPKGRWEQEQADVIATSLESRPDGESIAILYPSKDATLLEEASSTTMPNHLILLDGTWFQAKKLYEHLPCLHDLPKVAFAPEQPSEYKIRKEPKENYVSTLEALVHSLRLIEPENQNVEDLLHPFRTMVNKQLEVRGTGQSKRRIRKPKLRPRHWMPNPLQSDWSNQVVGYVEYIKTYDEPISRPEIVALVGYRPATNEVFARYMQPSESTIQDWQYERFELPQSSFVPAVERDRIRNEWLEFLGPEATLVAWHSNNLMLLKEWEVGTAHQRSYVLLKEVYSNAKKCAPGHLEDALSREGIEPLDLEVEGRSGLRLQQSAAIFEHLHQLHNLQTKEWLELSKGKNWSTK